MLSDALELAAPGMAMHQTKTSFIALRIADKLGFPRARKRDLIHASLLHDVGALSPEEKVELHSPDPQLVERHSRDGQIVLSRVPFLSHAAMIVGAHHTPWKSLGNRDTPESFDANIIHLADSVEISIDWNSRILPQHKAVEQGIRELRGDEFAPEIADAFQEAAEAEEFWLTVASPGLPADLARNESLADHCCSIDGFAPVSRLVRDIIDFRSTFTATHSSGVAASASMVGSLLGFSEEDCIALEIAGNLHDLGKMAVPNAILLKSGPLDDREKAIMRRHPCHTEDVLARARLPAHIIEWAAWHHERLDGSGYPRHAVAADISLGSRVISVMDVFTALAEERPYRAAMGRDSIRNILRDAARAGTLEKSVVELVQDSHEEIYRVMKAAQDEAAFFYRTRIAVRGDLSPHLQGLPL